MGAHCRLAVVVLALCLPGLASGQSVDPYQLNKNQNKKSDAEQETAKEAEWTRVKTVFKVMKKFPYISLGMRSRAIAGNLPLPTTTPITTDPKATKMGLDWNGDGKADYWAKGMSALMPLVLKYADGKKARYAIYMTHRGAKWSFRVGGCRIGSFKGTRITLVDLDSDGYYDGQGADGMIVGRDRYVAYLSSVLSIRGKLYECKVNRSGSELKVRPWKGESGKLDMLSGYRGISRVGAAILTNGTTSFNAARKNLVLPVGTYNVKWGHVTKGSKQAYFRNGGSITVEAGKTTRHKWGYPFEVDFNVSRTGEKITVRPNSVTIKGQGGEEYYSFVPAYTPKVKVRSPQSFKLLNSGTVTLC